MEETMNATSFYRDSLVSEIERLRRELAKAQSDSSKAMAARAALAAGSTRARVTSANARWARAAEQRDRVAAALSTAEGKLATWDAAIDRGMPPSGRWA
jgi:hypothetical protein